MRNTYLALLLLTLIAVATICGVFIKNGFPISRQALALDNTRIQDFTTISYAIESYYSQNGKLPEELSEVSLSGPYNDIKDPQSKEPYGYIVREEREYQLCTTFSASYDEAKKYDSTISYSFPSSQSQKNFKYKKGYSCITYTIPSTVYPYNTAPVWTPPVSTPTPTKPVSKITSPAKNDVLCVEDNRRLMWFAAGNGDHKVTITLLSPSNVAYGIAEINIPHENGEEMMDDYTWQLPDTMNKLKLNPEKGFKVTIAGTNNGKTYAYTSEPFEIKDCYTY